MEVAKLATLKAKLQEAREFREVISYFLDEIATTPNFMELGQVVEHPFLESVIHQVGLKCFAHPLRIHGLLLRRLSEQQFIYGGCIVNEHPGTMFYFEDVQTGLFTLAITGQETKFARFHARSHTPESST